MRRVVLFTAAIASTVTSLTGCVGGDSAGDTTCKQFAQMAPHTGLATSFNDKQMSTLRDMLRDANAVAGQEMQAGLQVIAYCNISDGRAGSNADQPIKNIPGLS